MSDRVADWVVGGAAALLGAALLSAAVTRLTDPIETPAAGDRARPVATLARGRARAIVVVRHNVRSAQRHTARLWPRAIGLAAPALTRVVTTIPRVRPAPSRNVIVVIATPDRVTHAVMIVPRPALRFSYGSASARPGRPRLARPVRAAYRAAEAMPVPEPPIGYEPEAHIAAGTAEVEPLAAASPDGLPTVQPQRRR